MSELSVSKAATQQIAETIKESLALHELAPEQKAEMNTFYPNSKQRQYTEVIGNFLVANIARLTCAFDFIGFLLSYADTLEDNMDADPESELARFQSMFDAYAAAVAPMEVAKLPKTLRASLAESMGNSRGAILRPSKRYPGGMDILHTGTPCGDGPLANAGNFNFWHSSPAAQRVEMDVGSAFEQTSTRLYQTDLSKGAIRAAKAIQETLFGNVRNGGNVFENEVTIVPLDFNWARLNDILYSIHPMFNRLNINLFKNLDKQIFPVFGHFLSLGIKRMPTPRQIRAKKDQLKYQLDANLFNEVVLVTDLAFEGALVLSIKPEFVTYLTQASAQKTHALYRWYQMWAERAFRLSGTARSSGATTSMPRYVTSATKIPELRGMREKFNYSVSDGDADANGITLMPNGMPSILPTRSDIDPKQVEDYEIELNAVQESLFNRGIPLSVEHDTLRTGFYQCQNEDLEFDTKVQNEAKSLTRFSGVCVGVDPDFHVVVTTDKSGLGVSGTRTIGAKRPNVLDTADSLGYDFSQPGEAPNYRKAQSFLLDMYESTRGNAAYGAAETLKLRAGALEAGSSKFIASAEERQIRYTQPSELVNPLYTMLAEICCTFGYMSGNGRVPKLEEIVKTARDAAGYDAEDATLTASQYDQGMLFGLLGDDFVLPEDAQQDPALWSLRVITRVLNDAACLRGSNLMRSAIQEMGTPDAAMDSMQGSTHYFSLGEACKLADMARVQNYFGGQIFAAVCNAVLESDRRQLYSDIMASNEAPPAKQLQQHILPFATLFAKVIPNSLEIFEAAEAEQDKCRRDQSITADDIKFPGLRAGISLLPHQLTAHQYLRRRPRYAVLFIAPGGGKTILGLTDIGCCMQELEDLGEDPIRPLIICPTNLATTWADDLHKIADGWNVIPITSDTVNTWGEERMYEVLHNAPRNTIFVAGLSFMNTGMFHVDIGGVRVQIRGAVEFINRFNFSYVLLDESHKVKNYKGGQQGSQTHFNAKLLFTAPSIRFARIATGTLVTDRVTDIVGQAALLSPAIFGDSLDIVDEDDGQLALIRRSHSRLTNHTAFINLKRKEWAFMLPNPVDTFVAADIADPSVPNSQLHLETYQAMYSQVMEMLDEAAAKARKGKSGDDDDEDDDDGGEDDNGIDQDDLDEGDILGKLLASDANLSIYFQRMEMLLTDPMGDDIARTTFETAGVTSFTSAKVLKVIERVRKHFEIQKSRDPEESDQQIYIWEPGVTPRELDIALYDGKKYMARKQSTEFKRQYLPPSMVPPPEDPETWKLEIQGKLIIFTRYTRSANAVYEALPEEYKRTALLFHGEVGKLGQDKNANLDSFKTDPRYQILIANEQAISEGHNMQMGSRIIRVDTPWSPGTYDQSTARIFRPDVASAKVDENGKAGDLPRELVFIDWIMTSGTLEVGKVARLMWKTVEKIQFDEKGNKRYEPLDDFVLAPIKMNRELLMNNNTIEDFRDYFIAKRTLNDIESQEFTEMRVTTAAALVPLTPAPPLADFRTLENVPLVANQRIPDPNGWGLQRLLDWTRDNKFVSGENLKDALHRKPVVTEFGNGVIVGINVRNVDGKLREDSPISTVRVRLAGSEELVSIPATKIHIATKVTPAQIKEFFSVRKDWLNETERKKANKAAEGVTTVLKKQDEQETTTTVETVKKTVAKARTAARTAKREENVKANRPVNEGVAEAAASAVAKRVPALRKLVTGTRSVVTLDDLDLKPDPTPNKEPMSFKITPMIYNGFISLEANVTEPDAKVLKDLEFIRFNSYAYVDILYLNDLWAVLDWIQDTKKLEFDTATVKRIEFIMSGFDAAGKMTFNSKQALKLDSDLKQFFLVRHRTAKDVKHIKAYPMVLPDRLRLMIDLETNPRAAAFVGVKVAGTRKWGKFEKSEGMWISFAQSLTTARARINRILKGGYKVAALDKTLETLSKIRGTKKGDK